MRSAIQELFSGGRNKGTSVPNKSQSVACVSLLRKIPPAGWFFFLIKLLNRRDGSVGFG